MPGINSKKKERREAISPQDDEGGLVPNRIGKGGYTFIISFVREDTYETLYTILF
jgi:hypothetical protein